MDLEDFVRESNRIEGIPSVTFREVDAHKEFLALKHPTVPALERFVKTVAGVEIRKRRGMNVRVGEHIAPQGGPEIVSSLRTMLDRLKPDNPNGTWRTPYELHQAYERLHPFMDGNGRSGRVLWAWHRKQIGRDPFALGFLHFFYYEALSYGR